MARIGRVDRRRALGAVGEGLAAAHLAGRGYRILERNFRTNRGELDLVAADPRSLVFCEVKTRVTGTAAGPAGPLDGIGPRKRRRLRLMAKEWLRSSGARRDRDRPPDLRFDAIGVTLTPAGALVELEHVEDAF